MDRDDLGRYVEMVIWLQEAKRQGIETVSPYIVLTTAPPHRNHQLQQWYEEVLVLWKEVSTWRRTRV